AATVARSLSHMLGINTAAPDFTLAGQDGEDVTLSSLRGRPVVLYFYPKADTPGS
ncbi:MAG: thioredoxin-dependent thiol peroxidase, partial [Solirubrobacterales bacterium]|nr:thioredoxin-dependent thiol peroxidase [Solirubrobacterales bacterium]